MENLFAISISDFQEKISFLHLRPNYDLEETTKIIKHLNKFISNNYLQEFISKNTELKFVDLNVNSIIKAKISIIGEVIVIILYESSIDVNLINHVNNRLLEAMLHLTKVKRVKIEYLSKKYLETINLLDDTLYFLDPKLRLFTKNENLSSKDMIGVRRK